MKLIFCLWILVTLVVCQSSTGGGTSADSTSVGSSESSGSKDEGKSEAKSDSKDEGKSSVSSQSGTKESKNQTSSRRDPFNNPLIVMYEPIYIETIKKSSIPINKPCTFRWRLQGKPNKEPESFTLTLLERRGYDVTYVIEEGISASDTSYVWDLPSYRPSENNDEAITLKPGGVYKMILHDSAVKYNSSPSKDRYFLSAREFTLYTPSDPNSVFSASSIILASPLLLGAALLPSL